MEKNSFKKKTYEMQQYEICLQWFEFITNDLFSDGKHTAQECNVVLSQFMSTMERAFEIPLLSDKFEEWSLDHPEVSELYRKVSDARVFEIYPDALEDTFQLDHDGDSCNDCDCYDADYGQCTMPAIDLVYACPMNQKKKETDNIVVNLGKRIKQIREAKRLTQAQLGELIGIKENGIRQYEIGRNAPRENRLKKIANALGVSWQWLVTGNLDAKTRKTIANLNKANILKQRDSEGGAKNGNVR